MDWQLIGIVAISAAALVAYLALGRSEQPQRPADRKIQGLDVLKPIPAPRSDEEAKRRLLEALKVQS